MFKKISLNSLVIFLLIGCGGDSSSYFVSSDSSNNQNSFLILSGEGVIKSSLNLQTVDPSIFSMSFYEAYNNMGGVMIKSFNGYTLKVYVTEPSSKIMIPSNETKAIYGTINGISTGALLKINSTYPDKTIVAIKVYKYSKLVGMSIPKVMLSNEPSLDFGAISTTGML